MHTIRLNLRRSSIIYMCSLGFTDISVEVCELNIADHYACVFTLEPHLGFRQVKGLNHNMLLADLVAISWVIITIDANADVGKLFEDFILTFSIYGISTTRLLAGECLSDTHSG